MDFQEFVISRVRIILMKKNILKYQNISKKPKAFSKISLLPHLSFKKCKILKHLFELKRGIISPPPLYFAGHSTRKKFVEKSPEKWQSLQLLTAYIYEKKREAFFFLVHTRREEGNVWLQFCFKWFKVLVSDEYQFPCSMTYI